MVIKSLILTVKIHFFIFITISNSQAPGYGLVCELQGAIFNGFKVSFAPGLQVWTDSVGIPVVLVRRCTQELSYPVQVLITSQIFRVFWGSTVNSYRQSLKLTTWELCFVTIWSCTKWGDVIIEFLEQKSWHFPLSHMGAPAGWTQFSGAHRQTDRLLWYSGLVVCLAWTFGVIWFFRGSSLPCTFGAAAACACGCFPSSLPAAMPILTCSFFSSLLSCIFMSSF